ncbi:hypothetical protein [Paenibacillus sp. PL2-23]|uniref:hypothetical protein n=1 Tax=Paenibacillus sp. PL2-23 TaxID=2100729 RepID=UPI0030F77FEF
MWERMLIVGTALVGMALYDGFTLRNKLAARGKLVYGALIALSLYAAVDFIFTLNLFDYLDAVIIPFESTAKAIEEALKTDWEK